MADFIKITDIKDPGIKQLLSAAFLNNKLGKTETVSTLTIDLVTYLKTLSTKPTYAAVGDWAKEHCSVKNPSKSTIKTAFDVVFEEGRVVERKAVALIEFAIDQYLTTPLFEAMLLKENEFAIDSIINTATSLILIPLIRFDEEMKQPQEEGEEEKEVLINFEECSRTMACLILHLLEFPESDRVHSNCQLIVAKKLSLTISYPQIIKSLKALSKIQDASDSVIDLEISRGAEAFVKDFLVPVVRQMIEAKCRHDEMRGALHSMSESVLVPLIKSKLRNLRISPPASACG